MNPFYMLLSSDGDNYYYHPMRSCKSKLSFESRKFKWALCLESMIILTLGFVHCLNCSHIEIQDKQQNEIVKDSQPYTDSIKENTVANTEHTTILDPINNGIQHEQDNKQSDITSIIDSAKSETDTQILSATTGQSNLLYEDDCLDDFFCLNGGTCIHPTPNIAECKCPEGFYGDRCQTRNICKTLVANGLTGDQICQKIGRECVKNDKFFRCACLDGEYFVFKLMVHNNQQHVAIYNPKFTSSFDYLNKSDLNETVPKTASSDQLSNQASNDGKQSKNEKDTVEFPVYIAECRPIDKCLGVRCKQLSEVCHQGKCLCNENAGYMAMDKGLCRLYDPCRKESICGEAKCITTYDKQLYSCICPLGYTKIHTGLDKSTTKCVLQEDSVICLVPILNECQHLCRIDTDNNSYYCTCYPGYKPGTNKGIDDHMCFFDQPVEEEEQTNEALEFINHFSDNQMHVTVDNSNKHTSDSHNDDNFHSSSDHVDGEKTPHYYTTKEMCNLNCDANEICILKSEGPPRLYECECDRQGYARVGDRCLNWCEAAKFSNNFRSLLTYVCLSGSCRIKSPSQMPSPINENDHSNKEDQHIGGISSWRPTFECNCDDEPILVQDKSTSLCKVDFQAILEPCKPGNIGYVDCVEQKNAFCVVLHRPWQFLLSRFANLDTDSEMSGDGDQNKQSSRQFQTINRRVIYGPKKIKPYTCVCSPEKKFLVDKPRDKIRCVNECDLLNSECQRFNRMCRTATMDPNYYGQTSLIVYDHDGIRINSRRSVCECLPGFSMVLHGSEDDGGSSHCVYDSSNSENSSSSSIFTQKTSAQANVYARCYLNYDVVEFHATFKAPSNFDPMWLYQSSVRYQQYPKQYQTIQIVDNIPQSIALDELPANSILVAYCDPNMAELSLEAYKECVAYRYPLIHRFRADYLDWREVTLASMKSTFDLMEGNIKVHVDECNVQLKTNNVKSTSVIRLPSFSAIGSMQMKYLNGTDLEILDADINCKLTLHSTGEKSRSDRVLLEKQLPKYIFSFKEESEYYLMAPNLLIKRDSFDHLAEHRKLFNPCRSSFEYCDKQTKCEMVDTVNFTCTCQYGYTPIGTRDIYYGDYRKEVCEDINECLFDACKELANVSTCINEVGDYRCQCNRHYTGDNKRYCTHVCNTIPCKHGKCRLVDDHHAFCECEEGYKETDCSVEDPNVALRKANMIIVGSIFTSVFLLAVTIAFSLNSQLRKTKKKLKRLEAATEAARLYEIVGQSQQPYRPRATTNKAGSSLSTSIHT